MTSQIIPVEPFDYIVFGGTGDLAERKLIPALYHRSSDGQIVGASRIIGAARGEMSDDDFRDFARKALEAHIKPEELKPELLDDFLGRLHYVSVDAKSERGWETLRQLLGDEPRVRAFYLASGEKGNGMRFNIGTSVETSDRQLHSLVAKYAGAADNPEDAPARLGDVPRSALTFDRAKEVLGWEPQVSIEEGVERTVAFFRNK